MTNYFASAKGYRSALVLMDDDEPMLHMLREKDCVDVEPVGYSDRYLKYYIATDQTDLKKLKEKGFERLVVCFGAGMPEEAVIQEVDVLRAFADLTPWRYHSVRLFLRDHFIKNRQLGQRFGNLLFQVGESRKEDRIRVEKEFKAEVRTMAQIPDPYRLGKTDLIEIGKLL